jgi:anti-sigma regulatory factor (Ser/Thr protein kinase)
MPEPSARPGHDRPSWYCRHETMPTAEAAPALRHELRAVLADWGVHDDDAEPALLVAGELLANAIDHARGPMQVTASFDGTVVRIEVRDGSTAPPRVRPLDPWAPRGRGLQLVDALAERWSWTANGTGKTVWADVPPRWPDGTTG